MLVKVSNSDKTSNSDYLLTSTNDWKKLIDTVNYNYNQVVGNLSMWWVGGRS